MPPFRGVTTPLILQHIVNPLVNLPPFRGVTTPLGNSSSELTPILRGNDTHLVHVLLHSIGELAPISRGNDTITAAGHKFAIFTARSYI